MFWRSASVRLHSHIISLSSIVILHIYLFPEISIQLKSLELHFPLGAYIFYSSLKENSYEGNADYTHKEIPPYNHRMAIIKKNTKHKITNNDEDVEKLEFLCTAGGNAK
jgi:hypothetical protein